MLECTWCTWELEWTGGTRAGRRVGVGAAAGRGWGVRGVWRDGEGATTATAASTAAAATAATTVRLLERFWEGGVQGHVRLVVGEITKLNQQAVLRVELAVPRHQDRREHWRGEERREGREENRERIGGWEGERQTGEG